MDRYSIIPISQFHFGSKRVQFLEYNIYLPINQRASYRVQMRDEWSALIVPAVNLKGLAMRAKSPNYASTVGWRGLVRE